MQIDCSFQFNKYFPKTLYILRGQIDNASVSFFKVQEYMFENIAHFNKHTVVFTRHILQISADLCINDIKIILQISAYMTSKLYGIIVFLSFMTHDMCQSI